MSLTLKTKKSNIGLLALIHFVSEDCSGSALSKREKIKGRSMDITGIIIITNYQQLSIKCQPTNQESYFHQKKIMKQVFQVLVLYKSK